MAREELTIFGVIWLGIGVFVALLDALDMLQLGFISMAATQCAQTGNPACLAGSMQTLILFMLDVAIGPLLFAANLISNPFLGIFGVITGLVILYIFYGRNGNNIIPR